MRLTKAQRLVDEISAKRQELKQHQERCKHPPKYVSKEYHSSTGNYDPTQDCYWREFKCGLCLKNWTEGGSR